MQAVEFRAAIENGRLAIPEEFKQLEHKLVRVVLLIEDDQETSETRALSNHSAGLVKEWQGAAEDDVWT